MQVSSVAEMRAMDRAAIERCRIPELLLMENAGLAVSRVIRRHWPVAGQRWLALCGIGNNGGDGLVAARQLHSLGAVVQVLALGDPARYQGAAATNYQAVSGLGIEITQASEPATVEAALAAADGVVDALLGTGITRPVEGLYAAAVQAINASGKPVVSVDIPSGVNGDTGQVQGVAVRAAHTVTFGLPKLGNLLYPGYELGGRLWVSHISFPPALYASGSLPAATNDPVPLPRRDPAGHKGDFGEALFVAGAASYYGAPYFAALSFMKAGGGYSRLATPASVAPYIAARAAELVYLPQEETAAGTIALSNRDRLLELIERMDFVVLGPGASLEPETQDLVRGLAAATPKPLLVDGDGLTAVSREPDVLRRRSAPTILTPHLGEMARLTGLSAAAIGEDRAGVARRTAQELNAIIVLKGAHSLIAYPDGRLYINLSGNAGMATAGAGDVLTGTIAAMAGLGLPVAEAARMGVFVHGLAGDLAAERVGEDGMTAQDILEALPEAVRLCRAGLGAYAQRYEVQRIA
ncbi:MAG TPA: NAD(P)H-hydrate dehydratase [Caldilineaceae bacterium]|nr:NAD(P)H-hydrate dehydratase [Caldilineaceae bacterium]